MKGPLGKRNRVKCYHFCCHGSGLSPFHGISYGDNALIIIIRMLPRSEHLLCLQHITNQYTIKNTGSVWSFSKLKIIKEGIVLLYWPSSQVWCGCTEDHWPNIVQQYYLEFYVVFIHSSYKVRWSQLTQMKAEGSILQNLGGASHWLN